MKPYPCACFLILSLMFSAFRPLPADTAPPPGDQTPSNVNPCAGHLTRLADVTGSLSGHKQYELVEASGPPASVWSPNSSTSIPCKRHVIDIVITSSSTPCANCEPAARLAVWSSGSDHVFDRPPLPPDELCESLRHEFEIYKRGSNSPDFPTSPIASRLYAGHFDPDFGCRWTLVRSDPFTTEHYLPVEAPSRGADVYRILSHATVNGVDLSTLVEVGYEH